MRLALILTWICMPWLPTGVFAQTTPQLGRVKVGSATVRSGPAEAMPACGTLEQGTTIIVDHPEGADWLAIQPPPGSLSWINHLYVMVRKPADAPAGPPKFPCDAVVTSEGEVKIATGLMGEPRPLQVQRTKLPEGSIVRIIGPKVRVQGEDSETTWYPILPPRGDFRYIQRSAVEMIGAEKAGFVVHASRPGLGSAANASSSDVPSASIPNSEQPARLTPALSVSSEPTHPAWQRARQAERDGNHELAEKLYKQLADEQTRTDGDTKLVNLCYIRIQQIRELRQRKGTIAEVPAVGAKSTDSNSVTGKGLMYGQGILRATTVQIAGKKGYALTSQKGEVWMYVIVDGIELDRYIGRWVELAGNVTYPLNLTGTALLTATQIEAVK